jgi:hypothetical protein
MNKQYIDIYHNVHIYYTIHYTYFDQVYEYYYIINRLHTILKKILNIIILAAQAAGSWPRTDIELMH